MCRRGPARPPPPPPGRWPRHGPRRLHRHRIPMATQTGTQGSDRARRVTRVGGPSLSTAYSNTLPDTTPCPCGRSPVCCRPPGLHKAEAATGQSGEVVCTPHEQAMQYGTPTRQSARPRHASPSCSSVEPLTLVSSAMTIGHDANTHAHRYTRTWPASNIGKQLTASSACPSSCDVRTPILPP